MKGLSSTKTFPASFVNLGRALVLVPLFVSCGDHAASHGPAVRVLPAVEVKTAQVLLRPYTASEEVVGTVRSKQRALVEPKVSGRVVEYTAAPGHLVKSGDLLVRLDVQEIRAKVDQAKAMLDQAGRDFERQKQLIASNATTRQDYDAAEARVKIAVAGLSEAETMLGYAKVTAPFDGVVTRKLAEVGDLAMPGKPLLEMESPAALRFEADLPEALIDNVKLGDKLRVRLAKVVEGVVGEISPVADPVSRTFLVKLDLPAADGVRTGQFGRVSVPVGEARLLLVPQNAILKRGQMEIVFVTKEGKAALRLVKTGRVLDGGVEILSGVDEGEQVVLDKAASLSDAQPVTLQP